jgi:hypothetical protein
MIRHIRTIGLILFATLLAAQAAVSFPTPSKYPISWELKFEHSAPQRILVTTNGEKQAYWFMTFTVTNLGEKEQRFLPMFELLTEDGSVIRSDNRIAPAVLEASVWARSRRGTGW